MRPSLLFLQSGGVLDRGSIPLISTKKTFSPLRNNLFAETLNIRQRMWRSLRTFKAESKNVFETLEIV